MIANQIAGALSGGVAPFTPSSIAGLKAWYDASDTATISVSGTAVTQWNDKSANGYNVTQGTSARRPISGVSTRNSLNVIDFDGNDMLTAATASNWTFMHDSTNCTVFWAISFGASAAVDNTIVCTASTTGQAGIYISKNPSDLLYAEVYRGVGGTLVSALASGSVPDSSAKYASMLLDNTNATASNRLRYKINGGSDLTGNTQTGVISTAAPQNPLYIGAYDTAGAGGLIGSVCEIVIYSGLLSGTDITSVNSYLASKWAI
jgi:hypothetical protein